jgi:hypothetical protein
MEHEAECRSRVSQELKQFTSELKNRPEIWGWYLYDEPPGPDQLGWAQAKKAYQIVNDTDGRRPITVAVADITDIPLEYAFLYRGAADVMMFDYYPLDHPQGFGGAEYFLKLGQHALPAVGYVPYWPASFRFGTLHGMFDGLPRREGEDILLVQDSRVPLEFFAFDRNYVERLRDADRSTERHFVAYFEQREGPDAGIGQGRRPAPGDVHTGHRSVAARRRCATARALWRVR